MHWCKNYINIDETDEKSLLPLVTDVMKIPEFGWARYECPMCNKKVPFCAACIVYAHPKDTRQAMTKRDCPKDSFHSHTQQFGPLPSRRNGRRLTADEILATQPKRLAKLLREVREAYERYHKESLSH